MKDLVVSLVSGLIGTLIGALIGAVATYYGSVSLLSKQLKATAYSELTVALHKIVVLAEGSKPIEESRRKEVEKLINDAYGRLLIFGNDEDVREFEKAFEVKDLTEKYRRVRELIIKLRKKIETGSKLLPEDIAMIKIVSL